MAAQLMLQQQKKKSRKKLMALNIDHACRFGLKVTSRSAGNSKVTACVCRFCEVFGREEAVELADSRK